MIRVLDASVALQWFFRLEDESAGSEAALELLAAVAAGDVRLLQPPHFIAEMAAVLVRKWPEGWQAALDDLLAIEMETWQEDDVYRVGADLAQRTGAHLFDTLYHATALHFPAAELVTADRRYFARARRFGQVRLLPGL
ncbi:type II toxin-antitoxin system VapC family toxin [Thioalkalivibrio sp. XN8]|uniref:type II toxin-antitoxin system VapC family toxin n=1 Tax=Thioalkalivibrio sp. XN8 TaxID=2712863 RepID=UPI0013EA1E8C|nr:type II toxin-antitoxin system VapC family toxin [Thioalkalivibrio sp. XN8]NGP52265.1 type II toxin-antitoxin system VapC family toxin [Thioalkalivibrio sp. XN8]